MGEILKLLYVWLTLLKLEVMMLVLFVNQLFGILFLIGDPESFAYASPSSDTVQ